MILLGISNQLPPAVFVLSKNRGVDVGFSVKLVNGFSPLTIFAKSSIVHIRLGSKSKSECVLRYWMLQATLYHQNRRNYSLEVKKPNIWQKNLINIFKLFMQLIQDQQSQ